MNFGKKSIKTLLMLLCVLMFLSACTSQPGNTNPTDEPDNEPEATGLNGTFTGIAAGFGGEDASIKRWCNCRC